VTAVPDQYRVPPDDPALWAARVKDGKTWHLTWRVEGGVDGTFTACGLEISVALWRLAPHFLTLPPGEQCVLCHEMAGPLFTREAGR
jgi:hypothetical protein